MQDKKTMQLSISDKALYGVDLFDNLHLFSKYGFTHIHFSYKWLSIDPVTADELDHLQESLAAANLQVLDVHGPHPGGLTIAAENPYDREFAFTRFRERLNITHALGGDSMVYHVPEQEFSDVLLARYIDGLQRLEEDARNLGIVIALENHYKNENDKKTFTACFEKFDPSYIGFTFDPGHANISGNLSWLLENCMDRLTVLHLNDNDGSKDLHWLPLRQAGVADWDAVIQGIAKSPYRKPVQLEVNWREDKDATREEFVAAAGQAARKIHEQIYGAPDLTRRKN